MKRLTDEEIKNCYDYHSQGRKCGKTLLLRTCNELLEYKTREKELGIDLITLFEALKNGVYMKDEEIIKNVFYLACASDGHYYIACGNYADTKDYGKTWSLDRKELEK